MTWIIDNWSLLVVIVAVCVYFLLNGKKSVMEWLLYAVFMAERSFESGQGKLKLHSVYDSFVSYYPILSKIIPFGVFSVWVDIVLDDMREMIANNDKIRKYVEEFKEVDE